MSIRLSRIATLVATVCVLSIASVRTASAEPIAYDMSTDFATGWTTFSCGPFGLLTCTAPLVDHIVTILMSDGTMDHFSVTLEAEPVLASILPVGPRFTGLDGTGATLQMLVDGTVYPGAGYPWLLFDDAVYDFDFNVIVPDGFRYIVDGTVTDVTMTVASVPEPGSLLLFGTGALALVGRRSSLRRR
jgi:hypothetical protein